MPPMSRTSCDRVALARRLDERDDDLRAVLPQLSTARLPAATGSPSVEALDRVARAITPNTPTLAPPTSTTSGGSRLDEPGPTFDDWRANRTRVGALREVRRAEADRGRPSDRRCRCRRAGSP